MRRSEKIRTVFVDITPYIPVDVKSAISLDGEGGDADDPVLQSRTDLAGIVRVGKSGDGAQEMQSGIGGVPEGKDQMSP